MTQSQTPRGTGRIARASLTRAALGLSIAAAATAANSQESSGLSDRSNSPQTLDAVTVTPSRYESTLLSAPAAVHVIESEAFEGGMRINLSEATGAVPGVQVQNRHNYAQDLQISMRGFGARSTFGVRGVRLYVDDIPATMPDGQGQTSHIDLTAIDRIETLNGPFSAAYGNSSGGVLRAYTAGGNGAPSLTFGAATGSHGAQRTNMLVQGATDALQGVSDYALSASRFDTDGYRDHSDAKRGLGNLRLGIALGGGNRLQVVANHVDVQANDPLGMTHEQWQQDRRQAGLAEEYNTRKTVRQSQLGVVWHQHLTPDAQLKALVYGGRRNNRQFQSIPPAPQLNNSGHAGGVIDLGRRYMGTEWSITNVQQWAGRDAIVVAGLAYDRMEDDRRGYQNFTDHDGLRTLGVRGDLRRDEVNTVYSLDPFIQASLELAPRWTLDAGLRYSTVRFSSDDHYIAPGNADDSGKQNFSAWSPSAAARWQANEDLQLYLASGRGFETPTTTELAYRPDGSAGLNWDLQPARSTHWEVGAKHRVGASGIATLAVFQIETKDEIVSAGSSNGRSSFRNAADTRRQGLELSWNQTLWRHARLDLARTQLNANFRGAAADWEPGSRIPGVAAHSSYAGLSWAPPNGWQAGVDVRQQGKVYVNDANSDDDSGYTLLGLQAGYVLQRGAWTWRTYARLDNALDRDYIGSVIVNDGNGRYFEPAPGRNWNASISGTWRFE